MFIQRNFGERVDSTKKNAKLLEFLKESSYLVDKIIITTLDKTQKDQILFIFENAGLNFLFEEEKVEFSNSFLEDGFYYLNENKILCF